MIDPSTILTPDVQAIVFGILTFIVTEITKRFHIDKELVWMLICVIISIIYCVLTWNVEEALLVQIPAKAMLVVGFSAGMWQLYKKWSGKEEADEKRLIEHGKKLGREEVVPL